MKRSIRHNLERTLHLHLGSLLFCSVLFLGKTAERARAQDQGRTRGQDHALRRSVALLLLLTTLLAGGCAHSPTTAPAPARLSHLLEGKVVVAFQPPRRDFPFEIPLSRSEAAGEIGSFGGLVPILGHPGGVFLAPVGLVFGAAYGAVAGAPDARRRPAVASVTEVLERHPFPLAFARRLRARIPDHLIVDEAVEAPTPDPRMGRRNHTGLPVPFQTIENRYEFFFEEGWDQLLVVRVVNRGLMGSFGVNPRLSLRITLHVSLIRTADGEQLGGFYVRHASRHKAKFTRWGADDARLFEEELIHSYEQLAIQVADALAR
jgi:hypothetical protein